LKDPVPAVVNMDLTLTSPGMTSWNAPSNQHRFSLDNSNEGVKMEIDVPDDVMLAGSFSVTARGEIFNCKSFCQQLTLTIEHQL